MYVVFVVVAALVVFAVVAVTLGRGDLLDDEPPVVAGPRLGSQELHADDLNDLRFAVVARGYRMDQVDQVLRRLGIELSQRDHRIAELEAALREASPGPQRPRPPWGDGW